MNSGGPLVRKFVLKTNEDAQRFYAFLKANREPMMEAGRFLQVVVSEYKATRSNESNAFMWVGLLDPIAEQAWVSGRQFSAETWAEYYKERYLPETTAKGTDKYEYLPDGSRRLVGSTSHLNKDEMTLYLRAIEEHAVTELGVHLPINPNRGY